MLYIIIIIQQLYIIIIITIKYFKLNIQKIRGWGRFMTPRDHLKTVMGKPI